MNRFPLQTAGFLLILIGILSFGFAETAVVPEGTFTPLVKSMDPVPVKAFRLDVYPVTNAEFLEFVRANPRWQKGGVPKLFADDGYLRHWASALEPGEFAAPDAPVTSVSWFAARAYAEWRGGRLPTIAEWERAAAMMPTDVARDQILAWYSRPLKMPMPKVGSTRATTAGIWDLHGLIWEWTEDFDSFDITSRAGDGDSAAQFFCGGGAIGVVDPSDYAAFLRYAFRGSLSASHTVAGLGFRCAHPLEDTP